MTPKFPSQAKSCEGAFLAILPIKEFNSVFGVRDGFWEGSTRALFSAEKASWHTKLCKKRKETHQHDTTCKCYPNCKVSTEVPRFIQVSSPDNILFGCASCSDTSTKSSAKTLFLFVFKCLFPSSLLHLLMFEGSLMRNICNLSLAPARHVLTLVASLRRLH